jgi:uncharacterized protein
LAEVLTPRDVAGVPNAAQRYATAALLDHQETTMASNQAQRGPANQDGAGQGGRTGSANRGFASMDPERQREIASEGGRAAHERGTAHEFTSQEAREAGSKGGQAAHVKGTAHEFDEQEARAAGRKGGQAAHQKGTAHEFDSEEARAAGRKGGQASRGAAQAGTRKPVQDEGVAPVDDEGGSTA